MVRIININKSYKNKKVLTDVSFETENGKIFGIIGESGCGKSTLAKIICGIVKPDSGEIIVNGKVCEYQKFDYKLQYVFQNAVSSLNPMVNVFNLVMEAPTVHKICTEKEKYEYFEKLMDTVELDKRYATKYPYQLSGGEQQRVALIRALAVKPHTIILDEVTSAQDNVCDKIIQKVVKEYCVEQHSDVIYISHDIDGICRISDQILNLSENKFENCNKL